MKIIYWSGTGNTETMANLIAKGIQESGTKTEMINISSVNVECLKDENIVVLGCPSMGDEELEGGEFLPFLENVQEDLKNKKVILFGSYGWGDGQWMRSWEEEMTASGVNVALEPLIVNYAPEGKSEEQCIQYGREIAKLSN
ncbi:flavodoxin [Clostridium botulinum]|uniref:Flavodoxin n=1 Tax=Clostridium botulinum TaxID=1491 RepID=A0A6B4JN24_CLOBO|nr:flavodoxin [Clostridium botulinum]EES50740.1 flavodoxin [Clostridium botulinum E1 str. 'BoNT E Beluga']MBY6762231.1 flavodoxin [Clostridium botulinum]MBY6920456.1 flavodoxin [Clostridium botulinum]MCR1131830.1 flavodoxin [Clostridium botulinum]NFJ58300.1 flavodoxin [Clostridium botulinum]